MLLRRKPCARRLVNREQVAVLDVQNDDADAIAVLGLLQDGLDEKDGIGRFRRQPGNAGDVDVGAFGSEDVAAVEIDDRPRPVRHLYQAGRYSIAFGNLVDTERRVDADLIGKAHRTVVHHRHIDVPVVGKDGGTSDGRALPSRVGLAGYLTEVVGDEVGEVRRRVGAVLQRRDDAKGAARAFRSHLFRLHDIKRVDDDAGRKPEGELVGCVRLIGRRRRQADHGSGVGL
jgi:hypothetical protein